MTTEISTQTDNEFLAELAAQAKAAAAKERPDLARVSTRAGILAYNGEAIKGNKLQCVIVGMAYENAYYIDEFDADNPKNPACFALTTDDAAMQPHAVVPIKFSQLDKGPAPAADCSGCWAAQWKSDPNGGKGKACKQKRRLLLLPTDALESPEAVRKAELAVLTMPVMSVKNYSKYVNGLAAQGDPSPPGRVRLAGDSAVRTLCGDDGGARWGQASSQVGEEEVLSSTGPQVGPNLIGARHVNDHN